MNIPELSGATYEGRLLLQGKRIEFLRGNLTFCDRRTDGLIRVGGASSGNKLPTPLLKELRQGGGLRQKSPQIATDMLEVQQKSIMPKQAEVLA